MVALMATRWRQLAVKARASATGRGLARDAKRGNKAADAIRAARQRLSKGLNMSQETLKRYRQSIDRIDAALVFLLAERFQITQAVGRFKAEANLPPADPTREERQIARLRALAAEADLDPEFSEKFLRFIIDEVIRHHARMQEPAPPST
ncbi:monofunctional chorismate mutase [Sphingomonas sp. BE123]|jgi:chorismate mutase|nr:monofunctional chorismate mutase [Sphingomonas sp. BE123]